MLQLALAVSTANVMNMQTGYYEPQDFQAVYLQIQIKKLI